MILHHGASCVNDISLSSLTTQHGKLSVIHLTTAYMLRGLKMSDVCLQSTTHVVVETTPAQENNLLLFYSLIHLGILYS